MILSFEITGGATDVIKVFLRGRGPSLTKYDPNLQVMANPTLNLRLFDANFDATDVANGQNDDWTSNGNASIDTYAKSLDFGVGLDDKDCALILDLTPGYYTAILSGVSGGTGIGWIAVDEISE